MSEQFSIYILKSQAKSLSQAETFLRNRKWTVGSGTDLREALAYIIQNQPQYVLITSDHPNKKVQALPKMLAQAFPVRVIGFAEKGSGQSIKNLQEMNIEYNLNSPVSGPGIVRMILRIRRDEELRIQQQNSESKNFRTEGESSSSDLITLKGDGNKPSDSLEQARAALSKMMSTEASEEEGFPGVFSQGGDPHSKGPAYWGGSSSQSPQMKEVEKGLGSGAGVAYQGGVDPHTPQKTETEDGNSSETKKSHSIGPDDLAHNLPQSQKNVDATSDWETQKKTKDPNEVPLQTEEAHEKNSSDEAAASAKPRQKTPILESEYTPKATPRPYQMTQEEKRNGKKNDSIIVRGTQEVLEETFSTSHSEEEVQKIEQAMNLACITIRSPRFAGYLICTLAENRKIDDELIQTIQKRLFAFLKSNGEPISEEDPLNIEIEEVNFNEWTIEQAEFLRNATYDGSELAIAFFPNPKMDVQLEKSASSKMLQISMEDLKENVPVEFDLYIFMPQNNKYLLFTAKGHPFYGHQKVRLQKRGVTHMHISKNSVQDVKKYRAQNFFNDKINDFKNKKKNSA